MARYSINVARWAEDKTVLQCNLAKGQGGKVELIVGIEEAEDKESAVLLIRPKEAVAIEVNQVIRRLGHPHIGSNGNRFRGCAQAHSSATQASAWWRSRGWMTPASFGV